MSSTYGFDPSCGNFHVNIQTNKLKCADHGSIDIQHEELADDLISNFYLTSVPWDGEKLTVAEIESLLDEAKVPTFIQSVSAIFMIQRCIDEILEDQSTRFPASIVVTVTSELITEEDDDEDEDDTTIFGIKPANPEAVDALERVEIGASGTKEKCAVCMEDYGVDSKAIRMPCLHLFHEACMVKWLERGNVCPLCRFALQH